MKGEEWECPLCAAITRKPKKHARWHQSVKGTMGPPGPMGPMGPQGPPTYFSPRVPRK